MPHDDDHTKGISSRNRQNEPPAPSGNSYLLAIGINEYAAFSKLKNAVKDVQDVAALLAARFGFDPQPPFTRFLLDVQATRRGIIHALENLCDLQPDDRALIFYSGHGYLNPRTKHGFWIPADAEKDDVASYLPNTTLRDYVKAMPCRHILLVSDSCFSGDLLVRDATRKAEGAFADWEKQRSRWIFCSGKGVVGDGEAGKNSPFAAEFLRSLREHKTAEPLNAAQLADRVTRLVSYNYEQQAEACPLFGVGHEGGQFIFYPKKSEADDWQAALAAGTAVAFEEFLKNHPESQFASEAAQKIAAFKQAEQQRREQQAHDEEYRLAKEARQSWMFYDFLAHWPRSPHRQEMRELLRHAEDDEAWNKVNKNSLADLTDYLEDKPSGKYVADARNRLAELKSAHKEKEAARRQEDEARRQSEAEKQAVADLAAQQEAAKKRQEAEDLQKKKEDDQRRLREAEDVRKQREAAILKQQQEDARLRRETEERRKKEENHRPPPVPPVGGGFNWRLVAGVAGALVIVAFLIWGIDWGGDGEKQNAVQSAADTTLPNSIQPADTTKVLVPENQPPENAGKVESEKTPSASEKLDGKKQLTDPKDESVPAPFTKPVMVKVKGGTYTMGCDPARDGDCSDDEKPAHYVTVPSFSIGKYEVTNAQFCEFLNEKGNQTEGGSTWLLLDEYCLIEKSGGSFRPKKGKANFPAVNVSWYAARAYCKWLNEKIPGGNYRLPSEAEWEFAARGAYESKGFKYSGSNDLGEVAWYSSNSGSATHPVGGKKANELDIHDMSGNVWEWCQDVWHDSYSSHPDDGSAWTSGGDQSRRVCRGGSAWNNGSNSRLADRGRFVAGGRYLNAGFRVAQD